MIELPGSFSGSWSSPRPQRGPGAEQADVVGDLGQRHGDDVEHAGELDQAVMARQRLELVGRGLEGQPGQLGDLGRELLGEALRGVQPGADRGAALGEL
jgi:hypothetical protein